MAASRFSFPSKTFVLTSTLVNRVQFHSDVRVVLAAVWHNFLWSHKLLGSNPIAMPAEI
jgi:hypothetical protein